MKYSWLDFPRFILISRNYHFYAFVLGY